MALTMKLKDLVEGTQMQNDEFSVYLNLESGEVITVNSDYLMEAEDGMTADDFSNTEKDLMNEAIDIVENPDKFLALPTKYDMNDYQIMRDFTDVISDPHVVELLSLALDGVGAFRRFKDVVYRYDLSDEWYKFRDQAYKDLLIEWCNEHGIEYIDDFEPIDNSEEKN